MKQLILISLLLSGCALPTTQWVKPGLTSTEYNRDSSTCKSLAYQQAASEGMNGNTFVSIYIGNRVRECMSELGYTQQQVKR